MNQTKNLGEGSVGKLLLGLAVPSVIGQIINLLYNIVDRIYIGHIPEIGANALTGVGLFTPILMFITAFAMLSGAGGAPRAAIFAGKGDKETAEKILNNCFTLLIFLAVILTVVFYIFCPQLIGFFGGSENTIPYAVEYGRIYILGAIFPLIVMGLNPFITTQGFAKVSMLTTVIGAVINIILDPIFIFLFDMGVKGAAWATVISQGVSAAWILKFLSGPKTGLKLDIHQMKPQADIILPCLGLGVSTFVMISTESFLSISFTSSLSEYGGDVAVGAMTILTSISQLITMPLNGVCQGGQPLMGFNFGAKKYDRVKKAFTYEFAICLVYTVLFWALLMLFPNTFAGIFSNDTELVNYAAWAIRIFFVCVFTNGFQLPCQQSFVSLGQAKTSLIMACLRKIVLLIPLIFILPLFMENKVVAVFMAEPISDVIAAAVTSICFFRFFSKLMKTKTDEAVSD